MAEDKEIHLLLFQGREAEFVERLILASEMVGLVGASVGIGPSEAYAVGNPGMQKGEDTLREVVTEHLEHQAVAPFRPAQQIPVAKAEATACDSGEERLVETLHPYRLKIREGPDVVIAGAEMHFHSVIHKRDEFRHYTASFAGNHVLVLEPEIPNVAQQVKGADLLTGNEAEKLQKTENEVADMPANGGLAANAKGADALAKLQFDE